MIEQGPFKFASPDGGIPPFPHAHEAERPSELGIYDENDRLTRAAIWGPVGAEAVLAQIYPERVSLFYDEMDVVVARSEAEGFQSALENNGVRIHLMRDLLEQSLPPVEGVTREQLTDEVLGRAQSIYEHYYDHDGNDLGEALDNGDKLPAGGLKHFYSYVEPITTLIDMDIERYGLPGAVALNEFLSVNPPLPLGNSIYSRDQMNVILGTRFSASMAKPIRQREVPFYEALYEKLGLPKGVEMPDGETFEGGDAYVHNGIVYVGVGVRTTRGAAHFIYKALRPQLKELGFEFAIVEDVMMDKKTPDKLQQFMHLDTFSNPISVNEMVVCDIEARNRRVKMLTENVHGEIEEVDAGTFVDFLEERNTVYHVTGDAQQEFACNFLAIDNQTILVADTGKPESEAVAKQLEAEAGKTVIRVPLYESTRGFGATHCMTGQLRRVA